MRQCKLGDVFLRRLVYLVNCILLTGPSAACIGNEGKEEEKDHVTCQPVKRFSMRLLLIQSILHFEQERIPPRLGKAIPLNPHSLARPKAK